MDDLNNIFCDHFGINMDLHWLPFCLFVFVLVLLCLVLSLFVFLSFGLFFVFLFRYHFKTSIISLFCCCINPCRFEACELVLTHFSLLGSTAVVILLDPVEVKRILLFFQLPTIPAAVFKVENSPVLHKLRAPRVSTNGHLGALQLLSPPLWITV